MSSVPTDRRYTREHEWAQAGSEPGVYRIGITDHAQDQLGDVVFVELPEAEREVASMETLGVLESVKTVSDLYCPMAGTVVRANAALEDAPELVNNDPYGEGWIFELRVADAAEFEALLDAAAYAAVVAEG